jgi:AraC family transcriptional regulator
VTGSTAWTGEAIIADAIGRGPDIQLGSGAAGWRLSRWRQFVGSYSLPALPDPIFVVHIAGKPTVRTWDRDGWSEAASFPGCATIVPAGLPTGWLVDGELDVVTLSMSAEFVRRSDQFAQMNFAFSDPLGVALTRQVLGELYAPHTPERDAYVEALVNALQAHMLRGPASNQGIPSSGFSAHRIHQVMNLVRQRPEDEHPLERMAAEAGVTPTHFIRIFKKASGLTPHQYVMRARIDRARELLASSDLNMAQISDAVGFLSQSHFTRAFRRVTQQTPGEYRRRAQERQH